ERRHEKLVVFGEPDGEELVDGGARVNDAPAEHAVAGIEEDAEADRDALARELRQLLPLAVLVDLEGVAREPRDQMALAVGDCGGDADELDARAKWAGVAEERLLRMGDERKRGEDRGGDERC